MGPFVQAAGVGVEGVEWSVLGHTYTPMQRGEHSMAWHALFPAGTFVPPHVHRTQDEFVYVLDGVLEVDTAEGTRVAGRGDLACLPMGAWHGLYNRSGQMLTCLFWVAPTRMLWELFVAIDGVADPSEVVRLAALHEIDFLPPPP